MSTNINQEQSDIFNPVGSTNPDNFASEPETDDNLECLQFWFDKSGCICADPAVCLKKMLFARDGQLSAIDDALFWQAIKPCVPCYEQMCVEKKIRELLMTKLSKKTVPLRLIEQIMQKIKDI